MLTLLPADATGRDTPATDAPGGQEIVAQASLQPSAPAEDDFVYADVLCYDGCQEVRAMYSLLVPYL
jgi:hypothetical protein